MPGSAEILEGLATTAASWRLLAVFWHGYFGLIAVCLLLGWRPSNRLTGGVLTPPLVSVSVLAWLQGNPFNGTLFAVLSIALLAVLCRVRETPIAWASRAWLVPGCLLVGFGWVYPHFLEAEPVPVYLYASPLGLVPCPTLSMAVGLAILLRGFGSRPYSLVLVLAGLFYGLFGSLRLGVTIDWALTGGALVLLALVATQTAVRARGDR